MKTGLENQTIANGRAPVGTPATEPEDGVVEQPYQTSADDHSVVVNPDLRVLDDVGDELGKNIESAINASNYISTLEAWATTLESLDGELSRETQVATELLLNLTTHNTGLSSVDVIPSMEDLASSVRSAGQLRVYAEKLIEALLKLLKKVGELFNKFIEIVTSSMRTLRAEIAIARTHLLRAKGGRAKQQRISMGRHADFISIRGMPLLNGGELYAALRDVGELADATLNSHLFAVLDCGKELVKIASSEGFPNPRATEARIGRAFMMLSKSTLAALCNKSVGSDTRFQQKGYVTTASKGLIGNRTVFKKLPEHENNTDDGYASYEFGETRVVGSRGEYRAKDNSFQTIDIGQCGRLLDKCEEYCDMLDKFARGNGQTRLSEVLGDLRGIIQRRAKDGSLTGETADLIHGSATAFTESCANPMRRLNTHLIHTMEVVVDLVTSSAKVYD